MSREAMQMALEALELYQSRMSVQMFDDAVRALRQALETEQKTAVSPGKGTGFNYARAIGITVLRPALETKQEPVAYGVFDEDGGIDWTCDYPFSNEPGWPDSVPLYTAPPKREWVGLTDEERHSIREWQEIQKELGPVWAPMMLYLYEAIEAKLREKNA